MKKEIVAFVMACFLCMPAYAGKNKRHNLEIAYEHSNYTYKEPHMSHPIKFFGDKDGVSARYTLRSVLSREFEETDRSFAMLEFRYMGGDVKYQGWVSSWADPDDVIASSYSGLGDYYFEAALKVGSMFQLASNRLELWPYLGIGWRQLTNHLDEGGSSGYKRSQTYVYVPLGTDLKWNMSDHFALTLNGQFDWMIYGNNHNEMQGDLSVSMKQNQGYGLRASVRADIDAGKVGVFVEPFWRYWHIQNSEIGTILFIYEGDLYGMGFQEPFNTTREYGLRVGITF